MSDAGGNVTDTAVKYKTMTVQVLRGTESRAVRKWEAQGWELVSQSPATLRTELVFRRPRPTVAWRHWAIAGAVVAVVLAVVIPVGIISGRSAAPTQAAVAPTSAAAPASTPGTSTPTSTTEASSAPATGKPQDVVFTPQNSPALAAILALGDYCDPSIEAFATEHADQTISFPGTVNEVILRGGTKTRYDIGISPGDDPYTATRGPAFLIEDVNPTFDFNVNGDNPGMLTRGTDLNVTARVVKYKPLSCLFLLDPVSTSVR